MTATQELQDSILGLEAALHGKRIELAMAIGNRQEAQQHMEAMHKTIRAQRDFRMAVGTEQGGCYFTAAGHRDQVGVLVNG